MYIRGITSVMESYRSAWMETTSSIPAGTTCIEKDTQCIKVGDGIRLYKDLPYVNIVTDDTVSKCLDTYGYLSFNIDDRILSAEDILNMHLCEIDLLKLDIYKVVQSLDMTDKLIGTKLSFLSDVAAIRNAFYIEKYKLTTDMLENMQRTLLGAYD